MSTTTMMTVSSAAVASLLISRSRSLRLRQLADNVACNVSRIAFYPSTLSTTPHRPSHNSSKSSNYSPSRIPSVANNNTTNPRKSECHSQFRIGSGCPLQLRNLIIFVVSFMVNACLLSTCLCCCRIYLWHNKRASFL
ncbi:hypothetical protein IWX91DRAFT_329387 [Phyllosticta citricarpa]